MSSEPPSTKTKILEACWQLMEQNQGQGVSMASIARQAGISRQALYLHFPTRTELIVATTQYIDEIKGLNQRLEHYNNATTAVDKLEAVIDVWGNYIPEIYGIAKAMLLTRHNDNDTAIAWDSCMGSLRDYCEDVVNQLQKEKLLSPHWSKKDAVAVFWTLLSVNNWEQLTRECGWSKKKYISTMIQLAKSALLAAD